MTSSCDGLLAAAERHGARLTLEARVVDAHMNTKDEVVGVEVRRRRQELLIGARNGVVFATGGFLHNPRLVEDLLRWPPLGGVAAPTSTGDLVRIAARAGARLSAMNQAWWDQVVVEPALGNRQTARDVFYAYGDAMIMVNNRGERAVNEKSPYSERGQAHFFWDSGRHEFPNRILFMVFDGSVRGSESRGLLAPAGTRTGRFPVPHPDESPDYLISGETWADLAKAIATRLSHLSAQLGDLRLVPDFGARLEHTVRRFNQFARDGHDHDFLRGETDIEKAWGKTESGWTGMSMAPFRDTGPCRCVLLGPGALDTKGGARTDPGGCVVSWSGDLVPGLFAAGTCAAMISGQAYWGPGATLGGRTDIRLFGGWQRRRSSALGSVKGRGSGRLTALRPFDRQSHCLEIPHRIGHSLLPQRELLNARRRVGQGKRLADVYIARHCEVG